MLHGALGFRTTIWKQMESFLPQAGIEMCYDQLGHRLSE
jgi:hypothetical protein